MQDKKRKLYIKKTGYVGLLLAALLALGGCTKKEELLFLETEAAIQTTLPEETSSAQAGQPEEPLSTQAGQPEELSLSQTKLPEGTATQNRAEPEMLCVHVCGAVQQPGVYELQAGSRVYEAVQAAGGFAEEADQNYVNQAQELADGVKLVIPTLEEAQKAREGEDFPEAVRQEAAAQIGLVTDTVFAEPDRDGRTQNGDGRININTASEAQLCDIPGIGATRAAAIAAYRESHGAFQRPEDIMKVSGIKEGMYEKIKDSISVN